MGLVGTNHYLNLSGARHSSDFSVERHESRAFAEAGGNHCKPHQNSQKTGFILGKWKKLPEPVLTAHLPSDYQGAQTCPRGHCISQ